MPTDPIPALIIAVAAFAGLSLIAMAEAYRANRYRDEARRLRKMLGTAWARKLGPDIDRATAEKILDELCRERQ